MKNFFKITIIGIILSLASLLPVYGGGNKDSYGLKPEDYDRNGWAQLKNGTWVPSPQGAVYSKKTINENEQISTVVSYTTTVDIFDSENPFEFHKEVDVNGLTRDAYDKNGWAKTEGGNWVSSPDGALYKGIENKNINFAITGVINRMSPEEKGMLKAWLLYGDKLEKEAGNIINSQAKLQEFGKDVTSQWVIDQLGDAFKKGFGFTDEITGKSYNYGRQLDEVISYLVKSFKITKPKFTKDVESIDGALEREYWVLETLLGRFISAMTPEERKNMITVIDNELRTEGIELGHDVIKAFTAGGMSLVWKKAGFNSYLIIVKITKYFGDYILGRTIPWVVYQTITTVAKRVFGVVMPVVGIVYTVKLLYDIPGVINPRDYSKYIPVVLLIGINRILQSDISRASSV